MIRLASVGSLYERAIVDSGREPEMIFLVAFLVSFGFIRTSAHLIRAEVSWWPGNVEVGGTHIHHLVWGILLMVICGYLGTVADVASPGREVIVALFGVGTGLTFDEFALWLNLRDVYWEREGRRSIDAVIVVATLALIGVTGFGAWVETADQIAAGIFALVGAIGLAAVIFAIAAAAKGRFALAAAGLLVLPAGAVGAFRLARPESLWARHLYSEPKLAQARARFASP